MILASKNLIKNKINHQVIESAFTTGILEF